MFVALFGVIHLDTVIVNKNIELHMEWIAATYSGRSMTSLTMFALVLPIQMQTIY